MVTNESSSNNVAIVALIVVGVLIAGGGFLYVNGNFGGRDVVHRETTIIEKQATPVVVEKKESDGFSLKIETQGGAKTETKTP